MGVISNFEQNMRGFVRFALGELGDDEDKTP
jgi:hypothetical protein